jgi:Tol biopolymer transport system component/imidazolonepropionase-like amidohydrolase
MTVRQNARFALVVIALMIVVAWTSGASRQKIQDAEQPQRPAAAGGGEPVERWDVTQPRGQTREIDFSTGEGTWMSVDLSPDGGWIIFDLLAQIYRVPAGGGEAQCLTQTSGVALNFHPRYSPDGRTIAFVSDRQGQNNLWLMNADGSQPHAVFLDKDVRVFEPAWSPDGRYLYVRRQEMKRGGGGSGIWMYSRDGGEGVEIVGRDVRGAEWPAPSPDGQFLYFQASTAPAGTWSGRADVMQGAKQLRRLHLRSGRVVEMTAGEIAQQYQGSSGGAIAPEISPDGRWLAFARRIPDGTISYKGQTFGPRTALWLRDLHSGAERVVMDPIEVDMAEGMKVSRDLPGYNWAKDSRSIVIAQGGKIRRLDVANGRVTTIPFTARVHRTISEMAYSPLTISDGPLTVKFPRWASASPDGRRLTFQAVGRIWVMDLPGGTPRRLTPDAFEPLEMSPAWSPDGQWIAFTSWADHDLGHVWKVPAGGGQPQRLTSEPGEYLNTLWSPDAQQIVVTRGSGATLRGRTVSNNLWYELVRVPSAGGDVSAIVTVNRPYNAGRPLMPRRPIVQASFGPDERLYYPETSGPTKDEREEFTEFVSIRLDGTERRTHLIFPYADEAAISPDGRWLAFQEGDNPYLLPFPLMGTGATPTRIDKRKGKLPVTPISREGGNFPRWRNSNTLEFVSGPRYFSYDIESKKTDTVPITLQVPRPRPAGAIALTGARIITLDHRKVIERGAVIVKAGRVTCVGACSPAGVDRVIDVKGKTIIPGFVDMHAHHHRDHEGVLPRHNWESAIYLAFGVTTTLDNSMWSENVFPTAEMIEAGVTIGPRTFSTGDPLYSGDAERQNEISSYKVAEENIDRLVSWGAITMKQYMQPRRDQRQWISDIARTRKLRVTAEGGDLEYNLSMIMDGQTGWEHPMSYAPLYSDAATFFGLAHASYSPTFMVGGAGPWNEEFFYQDSDVWKDEKLRRFTPWRMLIPGTRRRILRPATDYSFPMIAQGLADIVAHGGYGSIGSHGQQHGLGSHWETWAASSALGPMGALEVASLHGAHFLGADQDLGSIETGKLGDLMVLNSNPLDNIRNTRDILYVMKAGVLYDAATLDEIWPEKKPFGDYYWVNTDALRADNRAVEYWDKPQAPSEQPAAALTGLRKKPR